MKTTTLATKEADNKLAAYINAKKRSKKAEERYSSAQKQKAQTIFETIRQAYIRSACYLAYRDKFITVKVCKPSSADKLQAAKIEAQLTKDNVEKVITPQGLVYRFI